MTYRRLFELRLTHAYRPDGACTDFEVVPSPETRRHFANQRWIWRARPDGVVVLVSADAQGNPLVPPPASGKWVFELRLVNPDFAVFTALPAPLTGPAGFFTNEGAPPPSTPGGPIALVSRARTASVTEGFVFPAGASQARYTLGGTPLSGTGAGEFTLEGLGNQASLVYESAARAITVSATSVPAGRPIRISYPIEPSLARGVFAEVEIVGPAGPWLAPGGAPEFRAAFEARAARWRYFFITDVPADKDHFTIDAPGGVKFARVPADPQDRLTQVLLGDYPESKGYRVSSFDSEAPLVCQETGRAGLRLKDGDATVTAALPSPSLENLCRINDQPGFFHVVQRFAQP